MLRYYDISKLHDKVKHNNNDMNQMPSDDILRNNIEKQLETPI